MMRFARSTATRLIAAVAVLAALSCGEARAQVPGLAQVPDSLSDAARRPLERQRLELASRLAELQAKGREFNTRCAEVPARSPAATVCQRDYNDLVQSRARYSADATDFNERVTRAVSQAAREGADRRAEEDRAARESPSVGTAVMLQGDASMVDDRGKRHTGLVPVQFVRSGYEFQTGATGSAKIQFAKSWGLVMADRTRLLFEEVIRNARLEITHVTGNLKRGVLKSTAIAKSALMTRYRVKTPAAVTSDRGTEFELAVASDDSTVLKVLSGEIELTPNRGPTVVVTAGQMLTVDSAGRLGSTTPIPGYGTCWDARCQKSVPCGSVQCEFENR